MVFKKNIGIILGVLSIVPVIVSIITFYTLRGPNVGPNPGIPIFITLSIAGVLIGIVSFRLSYPNKMKLLIGIISVLANLFILVCAFLLLLAYGMSEA